MRVGILSISNRAHSGQYPDQGGPLLKKIIEERLHWEVSTHEVVADEVEVIKATLIKWVDQDALDFIVTTGGTGFSPSDVTPEATRTVIEREAPGLAEAMRSASLQITPHAMLSRAVCGIRKRTLIVNLPGSPRGAKEQIEVILPVLPHALDLLTEAADSEAGHQTLRRA